MTVIYLVPRFRFRLPDSANRGDPVLVATQNNAAIRLEVRVNLAPLKRDSFPINL